MILQLSTCFAASDRMRLLLQLCAFLVGLGALVQFYADFTWLDVLNEMFRTYKQGKIEDKGAWGKLKRMFVHPWGPSLVKYIEEKIEEFQRDENEESEKEARRLLSKLKHWKFKAIVSGVFVMLGSAASAALMLFSDDGEFSRCALYLGLAEFALLVIIICRTRKAYQEKEECLRKDYENLLQFQLNES